MSPLTLLVHTRRNCFGKGDAVAILIFDHDDPYFLADYLSASVKTTRLEVGYLFLEAADGQGERSVTGAFCIFIYLQPSTSFKLPLSDAGLFS